MAHQLRGSTFLGIDLAPSSIERGQAVAAELGLRNVELRQADLMAVGEELGQFDFIIAHGIYSWVPAPVRRRILELCRARLAPQGVAFVSYNAMPGGHVRNIVRDMMLFHTREITDPEERVAQARALVRFVADARQGGDTFRELMHGELERMGGLNPNYFFHDDLAEFNEAFYFVDFVAAAAEHGLQYLSETDFFEMQDAHLPPATRAQLAKLGPNRVLHQQYLDFIKCRRFHQTLLCAAEHTLVVPPSPESLLGLHVASPALVKGTADDYAPEVPWHWDSPRQVGLDSGHPLVKAALAVLIEAWPRRLAFGELVERTRSRLAAVGRGDAVPADAGMAVAKVLLPLLGVGLIDLHSFAPVVATAPGPADRPIADPLARWQAARLPYITSLGHDCIPLNDLFYGHLLGHLDGMSDRAALVREMEAFLAKSCDAPADVEAAGVGAGTRPVAEPLPVAARVERHLLQFARQALLVPGSHGA